MAVGERCLVTAPQCQVQETHECGQTHGSGLTLLGHRTIDVHGYRPLSRRLDRYDHMIQKESSDPNGGNVCLFSAATCMSQCKLHSLHAYVRLSGT